MGIVFIIVPAPGTLNRAVRLSCARRRAEPCSVGRAMISPTMKSTHLRLRPQRNRGMCHLARRRYRTSSSSRFPARGVPSLGKRGSEPDPRQRSTHLRARCLGSKRAAQISSGASGDSAVGAARPTVTNLGQCRRCVSVTCMLDLALTFGIISMLSNRGSFALPQDLKALTCEQLRVWSSARRHPEQCRHRRRKHVSAANQSPLSSC